VKLNCESSDCRLWQNNPVVSIVDSLAQLPKLCNERFQHGVFLDSKSTEQHGGQAIWSSIVTVPNVLQDSDTLLEFTTSSQTSPTVHLAINHTQISPNTRQKAAPHRKEATKPSQLLHLDLSIHRLPSNPYNRRSERAQDIHEES
jgi:hypothetical protein